MDQEDITYAIRTEARLRRDLAEARARVAELEAAVQRVRNLCEDHAGNAEKVGQGTRAVVSPRLVLAILDAAPTRKD